MNKQDIKLSIIIPYYNAEKYCNELLSVLDKQINDQVQVLIIDDGSKDAYAPPYKWVEIYRKPNGGASSARNMGLDKAIGEYVSFIDSDDLVSDNYVDTILKKIDETHFDYCYLSWKTLPGGWQCSVQLKTLADKFPSFNLCVWNRIYKREMIGDIRFNEKKLIAEDAEFIRDVKETNKKKAFVSDCIYYYRSDTPNSLTKRFNNGELNTKRVVFYYKHIDPNMTGLIKEIKKLDKDSEVIIMTENNEIPELSKYAMIMTPAPIKGTELRGEKTNLFTQLCLPIKTQLIIWTSITFAIGGIETFIYDFCKCMKDFYDIIVLYDSMDDNQIDRLMKLVDVRRNDQTLKYTCDTIIVNRITDNVPDNISYDKKIQMVHSCKLISNWTVNNNNDYIVPVSSVVNESFKENINQSKCRIINNLVCVDKPQRVLRLISCTRLTFEKGEDRMIKLAELLNFNNIPFIWTIFSETPLKTMPNGMVFMKPTLDVGNYIANSDYLVQLSDSEGFCYSIVESLLLGTPVITTPIEVLDEIGFKDSENGFVVPFDMKDIDIQKIYKSKLKFKYKSHNDELIEQWKEILGNTVPTKSYKYDSNNALVDVLVTSAYNDLKLKKLLSVGTQVKMPKQRALEIQSKGLCKIIGE